MHKYQILRQTTPNQNVKWDSVARHTFLYKKCASQLHPLRKALCVYGEVGMLSRPKRVWVICIILILYHAYVLLSIALILLQPEFAALMDLTLSKALLASITPALLIITSILLLLGKKNAHLFVFSIALIQLGINVVGIMFNLLSEVAPDEVTRIRYNNIFFSILAMILIAWATLSTKTRDYLANT